MLLLLLMTGAGRVHAEKGRANPKEWGTVVHRHVYAMRHPLQLHTLAIGSSATECAPKASIHRRSLAVDLTALQVEKATRDADQFIAACSL